RPRSPLVAIAAVVALAAVALVSVRPELGLTRTDRWLRSALGDSLHTRFATIYYNATSTDSVDLWRAANLTDFYITEHARALGILEGSAMALENAYNWRTLHQYANRLYGYKLAPPPAEIMSIGGFSSRRSSVSYVIAGSFSKWLIERYGMKRYLSAFAWGDFD